MCHYITAVLPADAKEDLVAQIMDRHGCRLAPLESPGVVQQLRPGENYFMTTAGHCDCGTGLGALWQEEARLAQRKTAAEREEARLRKQGWSETKIARWKSDKSKGLTTKSQASAGDWVMHIRELLASGSTPYICLLLHFYDGAITANVKIDGRERVSFDALSADMLGRMKEDRLYEFAAK